MYARWGRKTLLAKYQLLPARQFVHHDVSHWTLSHTSRPLLIGLLDYGDPRGMGGIHRQTCRVATQLSFIIGPLITKRWVLFIVQILVVHSSNHPDISPWQIRVQVQISILATLTKYTLCSAYIALKYVVAIEVGKRSEDKRRAESLKRLEKHARVVFCLNQRPLRIWAALRRLFSFLEVFCEQNSFVNPPDLRAINRASPCTWVALWSLNANVLYGA